MSVSARLEVDWSRTFHISVRKPQFWLIFGRQRADFREKQLSGLVPTPTSVSAKLEVDGSRKFHYIARKQSVTDRQTTAFIELLGRS